jgi:hypothetical protein
LNSISGFSLLFFQGIYFALFSNNSIGIDSQNQRNVDKSLIYFAYGRKNNPTDNLPKDWERDFIEVSDYFTDEEPIYEENPGGFPSNVISKLPKVIWLT